MEKSDWFTEIDYWEIQRFSPRMKDWVMLEIDGMYYSHFIKSRALKEIVRLREQFRDTKFRLIAIYNVHLK